MLKISILLLEMNCETYQGLKAPHVNTLVPELGSSWKSPVQCTVLFYWYPPASADIPANREWQNVITADIALLTQDVYASECFLHCFVCLEQTAAAAAAAAGALTLSTASGVVQLAPAHLSPAAGAAAAGADDCGAVEMRKANCTRQQCLLQLLLDLLLWRLLHLLLLLLLQIDVIVLVTPAIWCSSCLLMI